LALTTNDNDELNGSRVAKLSMIEEKKRKFKYYCQRHKISDTMKQVVVGRRKKRNRSNVRRSN